MVFPLLGGLLGGLFTAANAPALIGAGASLLGGAMNQRAERKAIASQNEYNAPVNVRARAEEAGFNPLLFVGPGVGQQTATGGGSYMGSAIADAGMLMADRLAARQDLGRLEKLQSDNQKLAQKVTDLTLRPKIGGIYASRVQTPTMAQALGRLGDVRVNRKDSGSDLRAKTALSVDHASDADLAPKPKNTYEAYANDGQVTYVPVGPDLDEVITGGVIAATNWWKDYRANNTFGRPLRLGRQSDADGNITHHMPWQQRARPTPRKAPSFGFTPHMGFGF